MITSGTGLGDAVLRRGVICRGSGNTAGERVLRRLARLFIAIACAVADTGRLTWGDEWRSRAGTYVVMRRLLAWAGEATTGRFGGMDVVRMRGGLDAFRDSTPPTIRGEFERRDCP